MELSVDVADWAICLSELASQPGSLSLTGMEAARCSLFLQKIAALEPVRLVLTNEEISKGDMYVLLFLIRPLAFNN